MFLTELTRLLLAKHESEDKSRFDELEQGSVSSLDIDESNADERVDFASQSISEGGPRNSFPDYIRHAKSTKTIRRIVQTSLWDLTPTQLELLMYAACLVIQFTGEFLARIVHELNLATKGLESTSTSTASKSFNETLALVNSQLAYFVKRRLLEVSFQPSKGGEFKKEKSGENLVALADVKLGFDPGRQKMCRNSGKYTFHFANQITQNTVYSTMISSQQRRMHAFIVQYGTRNSSNDEKNEKHTARLRDLIALAFGYLPGNPAGIEQFKVTQSNGLVGVGDGEVVTCCPRR